MRKTLFLALLAAAGLGCTTSARVIESTIRPRAAYDLDCPVAMVEVSQVSGGALEGTYGARGCGRRVRYEAVCGPAFSHCDVQLDRAKE
jgi:hypothetical protein